MLPDVHAQDGGFIGDDGGLRIGALRDCTPPPPVLTTEKVGIGVNPRKHNPLTPSPLHKCVIHAPLFTCRCNSGSVSGYATALLDVPLEPLSVL